MEPDLWSLYRQMLRSRFFEEQVINLWEKGKISGEMHMGLGEEAIAAGIIANLQDGDAMALDHRGTPPLVIRGIDLVALLKELLGRPDGLCRGMGGHMHIFSKELLSASSGIVGASGPIGVGFALASQHLRPQKLAVAFFGEGAMNQGMLLESLNLAAVWKLPVLFVCKDNELAITTHSPSVTGGSLVERATGFGMQVLEVDGYDVEAVWHAGEEATQMLRSDKGPVFILARCSHLEGHFLGDPLLRILRRPGQQMREYLLPVMRSLTATKGTSLEKRLHSLKKVASLVRRTAGSQKRRGVDPLYLAHQKLKRDKARLEEIEKEARQEIDLAVKLALSGSSTEEKFILERE